ncbi:hypothetical protein Vretimale_15950 [Volvox reticuliferus]|uniref:DAGKc domain-containing protein n=1 Tax=Volvox reticuliferus TaxID=1737510 RepID=A0A8J4LW80_9CHLO|nr:hypothetical protein Vretifemale_13014 [Volvox reticuliferus]GIM12639.1 hypothetical protein Vretimale_15950 [Volvox reticuliferus]
MDSLRVDPEKGLNTSTGSIAVRCGASTGTISLTDDGAFCFTPNPVRQRGPFGWLTGWLFRPVGHQVIPADQLLGARLESPRAFTVWFTSEYTTRTGHVTKRLYRAVHTPRFEVSDPEAATKLVTQIRRTVSWWGRDKPPHVAAIINPKAGKGVAAVMFRNQLLPLLRDVAGLRVSEHLTKAPEHATLLVRELTLNARPSLSSSSPPSGGGRSGGIEGGGAAGPAEAAGVADGADLIMFVGGDGTLHEGLQGLFQRADWNVARDTPLVAVPCGSGNGVAASCGLWDITTAAVAVCRGRITPIDVATVLQPPNSRHYCLLSVVYGAMANLDIGTNHLRWLGELRFHLGGLWEILRGRCYSCRVFVLPPDAASAVASAPSATATARAGAAAAVGGSEASDYGGAPSPSVAALEMNNAAATATAGRPSVGSVAAEARRGGGGEGVQEPLLKHEGSACGAIRSAGTGGTGATNNDRNDFDGTEGTLLSQYPYGPPLPLLSQLPCLPARLPDNPSALPAGWKQLTDSFAIFGAYNTQYLALGARANPGGLMSDGAWEVWQLEAHGRRAGAGLRLRCLKVLLGVEDGSFARTPDIMHVVKARAMLFQQRDSATWTVLDGEAVPEAPLYLEVHPRLCRVLVSPVFQEEPL